MSPSQIEFERKRSSPWPPRRSSGPPLLGRASSRPQRVDRVVAGAVDEGVFAGAAAVRVSVPSPPSRTTPVCSGKPTAVRVSLPASPARTIVSSAASAQRAGEGARSRGVGRSARPPEGEGGGAGGVAGGDVSSPSAAGHVERPAGARLGGAISPARGGSCVGRPAGSISGPVTRIRGWSGVHAAVALGAAVGESAPPSPSISVGAAAAVERLGAGGRRRCSRRTAVPITVSKLPKSSAGDVRRRRRRTGEAVVAEVVAEVDVDAACRVGRAGSRRRRRRRPGWGSPG